jgi:hypothetical protein
MMAKTWKLPVLLCVGLLGGELAWLALHPAPAPAVALAGGRADSPAAAPQMGSLSNDPAPAEESQAFLPPYTTLEAALQIPDPQQRLAWLSKILGLWAAHDPDAALAWARSQGGELRRSAIMDVLAGIAMQPRAALRLGPVIIAQEPDRAGDYALALVQGLSNQKEFAAAIQLVSSIPPDARPDLLASIFKTWGSADPRAALQTLTGMDPASHDEIFHALADGWSMGEPGDLATYAMTMPPGADRSYALSMAMDRWSLQDPAGMSAWLAQAPPSAELDPGIAAMLTRTDGANRPPALAMSWTLSITDPALRFTTAEHIMSEWKDADPAAARAYTESAPWFTPEQRASLIQIIDAPTAALDGPRED